MRQWYSLGTRAMEAANKIQLRSESDGSAWILQWDEATARLLDSTGEVRCDLPAATVGVWADHYRLVAHHTIILNVYPFGRLASEVDATAATQFLRAIYPLFVADERLRTEIKAHRRRGLVGAILRCPFAIHDALQRGSWRRRAIRRALKRLDTRGWPTELPASLVESSSQMVCGHIGPRAAK